MTEDMREKVRSKYAELAVASRGDDEASCCGSSCGCGASPGSEASGVEAAVRISDLSGGSYFGGGEGRVARGGGRGFLGMWEPNRSRDALAGRGGTRSG